MRVWSLSGRVGIRILTLGSVMLAIWCVSISVLVISPFLCLKRQILDQLGKSGGYVFVGWLPRKADWNVVISLSSCQSGSGRGDMRKVIHLRE